MVLAVLVVVVVVEEAKRSEMAPANQSRFSEERGPPHEFWTARLRQGQVERVRAIERSNF